MRMLAWINLLAPDGLGTRVLHTLGIEKLFLTLGLLAEPGGWLNGQPTTVILALVYGYLPFFILPLFVAIDRIDGRQIEAARDLGASPLSAFLRVTLPLSVPGHPRRRGADRAADVRRLLHRRPRLRLDPDEHDRQPDRRVHAPGIREGRPARR